MNAPRGQLALESTVAPNVAAPARQEAYGGPTQLDSGRPPPYPYLERSRKAVQKHKIALRLHVRGEDRRELQPTPSDATLERTGFPKSLEEMYNQMLLISSTNVGFNNESDKPRRREVPGAETVDYLPPGAPPGGGAGLTAVVYRDGKPFLKAMGPVKKQSAGNSAESRLTNSLLDEMEDGEFSFDWEQSARN
jgi:hypothetical protein